MKIYKPELVEQNEHSAIRARVTSRVGDEWLWYSVERDETDALAYDTADAFVMGLLPVAMGLGEDLESDAPVSSTLLFGLRHGYMGILSALVPRLIECEIHAEGTESFESRGESVATGISGGVDSGHAIAAFHLSENVPDSLRVDQLLYFNVGSNGDVDAQAAKSLFNKRLVNVSKIADSVGLPLLTLDSNLASFYDSVGLDHRQSSSVRNVAAALALQGRICRYLMASGPELISSRLGKVRGMENSDPFSLPLSRTERFEAIAVGGHLMRGEKMELIADLEYARRYLAPCVQADTNCGACHKCVRTQLILEIIGKLDDYRHLFDGRRYEKFRDARIIHERSSKGPGARQTLRFAAMRNYELRVSRGAYLRYYWRAFKNRLPNRVKSARRGAVRLLGRGN